jgi:putative DNA primase/helicase
MRSFHPFHLADLRNSGLSDETIQAAGIYTVPPGEIGKKLGGGDGGVISLLSFPYPGCEDYERFRVWYKEGKSGPKYKQRHGTSNRLYIPLTVDLKGDSTLLIVEGEKKALALAQTGYQVVGVGGVWNWCERAEGYRRPKENRPISDLDRLNWRRPVTILFDSDGHDNPNVRLAAFRLSRELSRRGAKVSILFLPHGQNGKKMGADDYLIAHGLAKLREMLP